MRNQTQRHSRINTNQGTGSVVCKFPLPLLIAHCSLLIVLFVSCADMFQPKIPNSEKNDSLDNMFRMQEEITKLQQPQEFYAAAYYSSTEIRLTWTGVRGAAYYKIERATASLQDWQQPEYEPEDGDYETLDSFVSGTSFTAVILKNAALGAPEYQNKYFYRVSAFNTAKKYEESDPTEPVSAMLFNAPDNLKASGGVSTEFVELRWERSPGADSYEIWRSDFPSGASATSLGTVYGNQTWFRNMVSAAEQGKDFYYMVSARNRFGNKTPLTRPAYGYARVFGAPDMPVVRLADGSGRGQSINEITIKWEAAAEPDAYYAVYRYTDVDSSLTRLSERFENTVYTDKAGLKPGVYYYYKVQAIVDDIASGKALKSQFSSSDDLTESFILSPPDIVVAEKKSDGSVTVKWKPAIGSEGERRSYTYNVYVYKDIDGSGENKEKSDIPHNVDGEGYISVEGLSVGSGTFFRISTVNFSGIESVKSIVVSPAPAAAVIQGATQRAYFQGAAANSNGVYPLKITWKKPANEEPAFYHVQRSTRSGSGFSTINETALDANGPFNDVYSYDAGTGVYTYTDKNETAKSGKKFYYRVLSLNQLQQWNFPSAEAIGWGSLSHEQFLLEYNKTMAAALKKLTFMHKPGSTDKLGTETKNGTLGGTVYYNAAISGLGARIIIQLTNYAEFYIENEPDKGVYFTLSGNSNTSANMSSNGTMDGTVTCTGMYPGKVSYDRIEIKGGAAGGGTYGVEPEGGGRRELGYTILN
jgi:ABC-type cobalt transport system substrate-binding protein